MVLIGTGVYPKTVDYNLIKELLANGAITLDNRSVKCNTFLQTSDDNIFAAGDCCSFPSHQTGERVF